LILSISLPTFDFILSISLLNFFLFSLSIHFLYFEMPPKQTRQPKTKQTRRRSIIREGEGEEIQSTPITTPSVVISPRISPTPIPSVVIRQEPSRISSTPAVIRQEPSRISPTPIPSVVFRQEPSRISPALAAIRQEPPRISPIPIRATTPIRTSISPQQSSMPISSSRSETSMSPAQLLERRPSLRLPEIMRTSSAMEFEPTETEGLILKVNDLFTIYIYL
jgi:hypothetical protein